MTSPTPALQLRTTTSDKRINLATQRPGHGSAGAILLPRHVGLVILPVADCRTTAATNQTPQRVTVGRLLVSTPRVLA